MSSEGDSAKSAHLEPGDEKSDADRTTDSSQDASDAPVAKPTTTENHNDEKKEGPPVDGAPPVDAPSAPSEKPDKKEGDDEKKTEVAAKVENSKEEKEEKMETDEKPATESKSEEKEGESKEEVKKKTEKTAEQGEDKKKEVEDNEEEEEEEEEGDESGKEDGPKEKGKPLLDQPLEQKGKRERKNVQRFNEQESKESKDNNPTKVEIVSGAGTALGEIPRVDASISRFKNDDLKLLHRLLFKNVGKSTLIKKNIRQFSGFDFKRDSEEYTKKIGAAQKLEVKNLKSICEMLDLQKSGTKDEIIDRVMDFLMEPKDSGKQVDGGRPKRSAAVKANNRGYSSHDDYSSDDRATRSRRDKGKRSNLKDDTSSDEDFQPNQSDASDDRSHATKRRRRSAKKKSSDEESEASVVTTDDSDFQDEPKAKRTKTPAKANNRAKPRGTGRRGRPPASAKRTPGRQRKKAPSTDEDSEDNKKDDGSSSEDEPLVKKTKSNQPPTDDEIKTFIKSILEGANLEEITMKTVCQRVYSNYPEFDLTHKKDFIKSTVKSLIST